MPPMKYILTWFVQKLIEQYRSGGLHNEEAECTTQGQTNLQTCFPLIFSGEYSNLLCKRDGYPCQNSKRSGRSLYPLQCLGFGIKLLMTTLDAGSRTHQTIFLLDLCFVGAVQAVHELQYSAS